MTDANRRNRSTQHATAQAFVGPERVARSHLAVGSRDGGRRDSWPRGDGDWTPACCRRARCEWAGSHPRLVSTRASPIGGDNRRTVSDSSSRSRNSSAAQGIHAAVQRKISRMDLASPRSVGAREPSGTPMRQGLTGLASSNATEARGTGGDPMTAGRTCVRSAAWSSMTWGLKVRRVRWLSWAVDAPARRGSIARQAGFLWWRSPVRLRPRDAKGESTERCER
jgi:hypothetical protein